MILPAGPRLPSRSEGVFGGGAEGLRHLPVQSERARIICDESFLVVLFKALFVSEGP